MGRTAGKPGAIDPGTGSHGKIIGLFPGGRWRVYVDRMQKVTFYPVCFLLILTGFGVGGSNVAAGAVLKDVSFAFTNDVGFGNEVVVLGAHPLLGGHDPRKAIKLVWTSGNVWRGTIALPAGETIGYRYVRRAFGAGAWGSTNTDAQLSGNLSVSVPAHTAAPWEGKAIFLRSGWNQAIIVYRDLTANGPWTNAPMNPAGTNLFRVDGIAPDGAELEFVFNSGPDTWLNAPAPPTNPAQGAAPSVPVPYQGLTSPYNFRTSLDVFMVQDQQIFNYEPPASGLSAPRVEWREVGSMVAGIPGRWIGIYLPRGYDNNTWKKYPVIYFHDGQNDFFPGGPYGTWDADRIATYEISQGRMRECIIVAVNNGDGVGSSRLREYLPDGDSIYDNNTTYNGAAASYLQFLVDNVTPTLDLNFRTLGDAANTMTAGSSMGGLVTDYILHQKSDRFGVGGIFSPAYWAAPNYMGGRTVARLPVRRYLYMGTAESGGADSTIYWQDVLSTWNQYLGLGHPANRELMFEGGAGAVHNEPAWSLRLPAFFAYALDARREANLLAARHFPPRIVIEPAGDEVTLRWVEPYGFKPVLESRSNLQVNWSPASTTPTTPVTDLWADSITNAISGTGMAFWGLSLRLP